MHRILLMVGVLAWLGVSASVAQVPAPPDGTNGASVPGLFAEAPRPMEILGVSVEGVENESLRAFVLQSSGLAVGQEVTVPGDPSFGEAIRNVYRLGQFSDVKIVEEREVGNGLYLAIRVKEEPRLAAYEFEGIKKKHRKDLKKNVPLLTGSRVRPSDVERAKQVITDFFEEKGHLLTEVEVRRTVTEDNAVNLLFDVDRGPRVEVGEIVIEGNQEVSDRRLRKKMDTKTHRWWRFWGKETFKRNEFEEDLQKIVDFYREKGYYDARVVRDTVFLQNEGGEPEVVVKLGVHEGPKYHIRSIDWEGNTIYPDQVLTTSLGFEEGEAFNAKKLEENLYANQRSSDVSSLFMNRGHMRFRVQPEIRVVEGDSLDLHFEIFEGDVYDIGTVIVEGNTKTKDHVVRRELYTIPGQPFSRSDIQESIRRLMQLQYFSQESLGQGPDVRIDEPSKSVDLTYKVEEVGSDQLELSGTWGQLGLILMLRFTFNNFSAQNLFKRDAYRPLPTGDGQKLSLGVQTNGTYYQSYSLGFTEPWFKGRPTPVGFSLSFTRIGRNPFSFNSTNRGDLVTSSARLFYDQRLKWPDDKFTASTGLRYQYFFNEGWTSTLPQGSSQQVTLQQSLTRSSVDNPLFPSVGSFAQLSLELAPPIPGFIQYHKWRFRTNWNVPLIPKISLGVTSDFGYIGSLTGEDVSFERFVVGGSPFDTQGLNSFFGRDVIYMRGYPAGALGPRFDNDPVGGRILNKYTSELRWMAISTPQLQAAPYLFADAANTWNDFGTYNPAQLFRSAGLGMRLFLPIIGMLELVYGYNFDAFTPVSSGHDGLKQWTFQFTLGQGFNQ